MHFFLSILNYVTDLHFIAAIILCALIRAFGIYMDHNPTENE